MFGSSSSATIMQLQPVSQRIVDTLMPLTVPEERYLLEPLSFRQKNTFSFTLEKAVQQKNNPIYSVAVSLTIVALDFAYVYLH